MAQAGQKRNGVVGATGVVALLFVLATRCVPHPIGTARTYATYEGKAATTAKSALSHVQTVRLAAETATAGKAFGPYVTELVSDAEEALDGLESTFGSIQPPGARADALGRELGELLASAAENVRDVRVAARRGALSGLEEAAEPLGHDADALQRFQDAHG